MTRVAECRLSVPVQAATQYQSWDATGKEREQAIYDEIQRKLDLKRPDREELGTLGCTVPQLPQRGHTPQAGLRSTAELTTVWRRGRRYVGGEYTKKSAAARRTMEENAAAKPTGSGSSAAYMKPEDLVMLGSSVRRVAAP